LPDVDQKTSHFGAMSDTSKFVPLTAKSHSCDFDAINELVSELSPPPKVKWPLSYLPPPHLRMIDAYDYGSDADDISSCSTSCRPSLSSSISRTSSISFNRRTHGSSSSSRSSLDGNIDRVSMNYPSIISSVPDERGALANKTTDLRDANIDTRPINAPWKRSSLYGGLYDGHMEAKHNGGGEGALDRPKTIDRGP